MPPDQGFRNRSKLKCANRCYGRQRRLRRDAVPTNDLRLNTRRHLEDIVCHRDANSRFVGDYLPVTPLRCIKECVSGCLAIFKIGDL